MGEENLDAINENVGINQKMINIINEIRIDELVLIE